MGFLIFLAVLLTSAIITYLIIFLVFKVKIKNFKPISKPQKIEFKLYARKHADFENIRALYSEYYFRKEVGQYITLASSQYTSILKKCRFVFDKKNETKFSREYREILEELKPNSDEQEKAFKELTRDFLRLKDSPLSKYFPSNFILEMIASAGKYDVDKTFAINYSCLAFNNGPELYLFFPTCILYINHEKKGINEILYKEAKYNCRVTTETTHYATNREIISHRWLYQRSDGGPDRRYSGNYCTYVVNVYNVSITFFALTRTWTLYLKKEVDEVKNTFDEYVEFLELTKLNKDQNSNIHESVEYFDNVKNSKKFISISENNEASLEYGNRYENGGKKVKLYIPKGVTTLKDFSYWSDLEEVRIPSTVTKIEYGAFRNCIFLKAVYVEGNNLTSIGDWAFDSCERLVEFKLPRSIKTIGSYCFSDCKKLQYLSDECHVFELNENFGNQSWDFVESNFIDCVYLNCEKLPKSPDFYEKFMKIIIRSDISLSLYKQILEKGTFEQIEIRKTDGNVDSSGELTGIKFSQNNVYIPECVKSIRGCSLDRSVKQIHIPNSVVYLEPGFLTSSLTNITLPDHFEGKIELPPKAKVIYIKSKIKFDDEVTINKKTYSKLSDSQLAYASTAVIEEFFDNLGSVIRKCNSVKTIKLNVQETKIPKELFKDSSQLEEVICSDSITGVGSSAFENCINLKTFVAKNIKAIDSYAFANCQTIKEFDANKVAELKEGAFKKCISLEKVVLNKQINSIAPHLFDGCKSLTSLNIDIKDVGEYGFAGCEKLNFEKLIPTLETINDGVFKDNILLKNVEINKKVKAIGDYAFAGCSNLSTFKFEKKLKFGSYSLSCTALSNIGEIINNAKLGPGTFANCLKIKDVKLPYGLTSLPSSLFEGCTNLGSIYIPDSVLTIGTKAFKGDSALEDITGMSELVTISQDAFKDCSSLRRLIFPQTLKQCVDPFIGCKKLKEIIFTGNLDKLSLNLVDLKSLKVIYAPLLIEDFALFEGWNMPSQIEFYCLRGSNWPKLNRYVNAKYIAKEEYQIAINKYLLEAGHSLIASNKKIEMSERYFGKFDKDFSFDASDLIYDEKPVEKKRAGWDTVVVKEEDKSKSVEKKVKDNYGKISVYDGTIPFESNGEPRETNKEQIECEGSAVSTFFPITYIPAKDLKTTFSFIVDIDGKRISNRIRVDELKKNKKVNYNIGIDTECENGQAFVVILDGTFGVLSIKKIFIERSYNIDALLDF